MIKVLEGKLNKWYKQVQVLKIPPLGKSLLAALQQLNMAKFKYF
jgi:hypothetical protein